MGACGETFLDAGVFAALGLIIFQRQTDTQSRALPWCTFDVERSADQARSFPQANKAVVPGTDLRRIEADAIVVHRDVE